MPSSINPGDPAAPESSTEWQRVAARKAFQNDLPGAITAMERAVALEPNSFHHWMWLGRLYRQIGDSENSRRTSREGLRCLQQFPDRSLSPEERTRLIVRASLHAGDQAQAVKALENLQTLRRTVLEGCVTAPSFENWYMADLRAAATFETVLELHRILAEPGGIQQAISRYSSSLRHGLALAETAAASEDDLSILRKRLADVLQQTSPIELS